MHACMHAASQRGPQRGSGVPAASMPVASVHSIYWAALTHLAGAGSGSPKAAAAASAAVPKSRRYSAGSTRANWGGPHSRRTASRAEWRPGAAGCAAAAGGVEVASSFLAVCSKDRGRVGARTRARQSELARRAPVLLCITGS